MPQRFTSSSSSGPEYRRYEITDTVSFPYSTHGKIYAHDPVVGDYVCSATVVPSPAKNLVWTAGHCLTNEGVWADRVMFVPGYRLGNRPYGTWVAEQWGTSPDWFYDNNYKFDFGAMIMLPDANGVEIADAVGSRGIIFEVPPDQYFYTFGYPGKYPFDGEREYVCESPYAGTDPYSPFEGPDPLAIGCDMTPGASGGGWVIEDATSSYVNSVVSYSKPIFPEVYFGPYFGSDARLLWEQATATSNPTPLPTPTPTADPVTTHEMRLSLSLRKHLIAKGAMIAPDGYGACTRGAPIGVFKKTSSGWKLLKTTLTNDLGRYRLQLRDSAGRYAAYGLDGYVDDSNYCTDSFSSMVSHRH